MMNLLKIIAIVIFVSLMLETGFQVNRDRLLAILRDYSLLGRTFLANFILVPLYGVLLAQLFHLDRFIGTGFLLMSIAPGGAGALITGGRRVGGSLGFAVSSVFLMRVLSILTVPITAHLIFPAGSYAHVPTRHLVVTIAVFQLLPLLIGMLVADRAPTVAAKLHRPVTLLLLISALAFIVLVFPTLAKAVASVYGTRGIMAMLVIVILSLATGWLLGGPEREYRRTLSFVTALRNFGFGALVATDSFPGTPVAAAVVAYFLVQVIVTSLFQNYLMRTAKKLTAGEVR